MTEADTDRREGSKRCVIIGAGPAGLTAAYELSKAGIGSIVLEQDEIVGGIARTVEHEGYRFDIGGHRFYSRMQAIEDWWRNILEDEFLIRPRLSRIYYDNKFFDYPLKPLNALANLGPIEAIRIAASYAATKIAPYRQETNLEEWISNRFGRRLYEIFFRSYTEKVWGMKCTEIGADWAAQRIKNLDLRAAVRSMFLGNRQNHVTSLIEQFRYPRLGPGMMWERVTELVAEQGCRVRLEHEVTKIELANGHVTSVTAINAEGNAIRETGSHFISSMPIRNLVEVLDPPPPSEVRGAAARLRYRDFLTVGLIVEAADVFPDNWIYVHSPRVKVGRIQNFKNWSPEMVPDQSMSTLGLEYFVQEGDELWSAADNELVELARRECAELGLVEKGDVVGGVVIRMPKAYPVYDRSYQESLAIIRRYLDAIPNFQLIGRNGQHRYNNQDHSMLTAIYAARNISGAQYDVWDVNVEAEYSEELNDTGSEGVTGERLIPQLAQFNPVDVLRRAFARYDPVALGCALGVVMGTLVFLATATLLLQGGDVIGPHLSLLGNYLWGYRVTWMGAILGFLEAGIAGFILGLVMANIVNGLIGWQKRRLIRRLEYLQILQFPRSNQPI